MSDTPSASPAEAGPDARLVLVGGGRMGGALLGGWIEGGQAGPEAITVVEPDAGARARLAERGVAAVADPGPVLEGAAPDLVLFAVKPQVTDDVVPAYRPLAGAKTAFLSIVAGRTIAYFEGHLGADAAIVRAMPNTPAQVGRGVTVLTANTRVAEGQRALATGLMAAVGDVLWVEDEALMDAVTAVSGSGPAYVFYLIECLAAAARAAGLEADMAMRLARGTVTGAAELAYRSDETAESLRVQVTSPGGTTAAALEVLMAEGGLEDLMTRAVAAAARRSRELAG